MSGTLRVALAQVMAGDDPDANLAEVGRQVAEAAAAGARLVVFPEATMRRFGPGLATVAEPADGPWAAGLREVAERHQVVLVAGMFTPADGGRIYNTLRAVVARWTRATTRSTSSTRSASGSRPRWPPGTSQWWSPSTASRSA